MGTTVTTKEILYKTNLLVVDEEKDEPSATEVLRKVFIFFFVLQNFHFPEFSNVKCPMQNSKFQFSQNETHSFYKYFKFTIKTLYLHFKKEFIGNMHQTKEF